MAEIKRRSFLAFFFLNILTFGIYGIVVFCQMGEDINKICCGDNKEQCSYIIAWLLGLVTLGIYPLFWIYTAIGRLGNNAYRYGINIKHNQSDFLLWYLLGSFIIIGPLIAYYHFLVDVNQFADVYGKVEASGYSADPSRRLPPKQISNDFQYQNAGYQQNNRNSVIDSTGPTDSYGINKYPKGKIAGLTGMYAGTNIPMVHNDLIKIGKDPSRANIVIEGSHISGLHCSIKYDAINNCYVVTDCSTNGTYLQDGRRLNKNTPTNLPLGSVIYITNRDNSFSLN